MPRYAFLRNSVVFADINANTDYKFERIFVDHHKEAYQMLKSGAVDAFFGMDTAEGAFDEYGDVVGEDFYPLIFRSSCLSTQNEELRPIINALEKAMSNRVLEYLTELQKRGHDQYLENKLYTLMTKEELNYIKNNPVISIGADFSNYPISFFNFRTNKWEGIYFEALKEIEKLTGLKFQPANDQNTPVLDMIKNVENGKALIIPELFQIKEYEGRFLWSDVPIVSDNFAFVSRADFRNIDINDIFHLHVGLRGETIYSELFKKIFPAHLNYTEYDTQEKTWDALASGDVDVIFSSRRRLTIYTNYYEDARYKLNLVFNHTFNSYFGYNKDADILKSIVDKALRIVDINNISNQWVYKTYDYRNKLAAAQRPWLVGASVLFFLVLVLVSVLFIRSRSVGKQLENLVSQRTGALALETSKLKTVID
ncbi:type 2 periplasmic-binding domain-containing protein, partial [Treponema sp. R8-4-B8]